MSTTDVARVLISSSGGSIHHAAGAGNMENVGVLSHERQPAEQEAYKKQFSPLAWRAPSISAEQLYQTVSIVLCIRIFLSLVTKGRPSARAVAPMMQSQGSLE